MLTLGLTGRIWVAVAPVDARKSFDTLAAVVTAALGRDPLSGDLFVFANRKRDRLAVLAWLGDGFALLRRRLEKGTFALPAAGDTSVLFARLARRIGMTPRERELESDNAHLRATVAELRDLVADLHRQLDRQQVTIDRLTKIAFGRSTERLPGPTPFDVLDPPAAPSHDTTPADTHLSPLREAPPGPPRRGRHGRREPSPDRPVEPEVIDLTDAEKACPCCGGERVRVGLSEPSRRHEYRPAAVFVRETRRVSYACRSCERAGSDPQFARPPLPPEPIPRSRVAAGLLAHVVASQLADHLPLHRQQAILARHGFPVSRSTTCDWLRASARVLDPLDRTMLARVRASHAVRLDDTPVTRLDPRRTAYAWVAVGDETNPTPRST